MTVRLVRFVPELCAPCAQAALEPSPKHMLYRLCADCRRKVSAAAEAFANAVAAEKASERTREPLHGRRRRAILRSSKGD